MKKIVTVLLVSLLLIPGVFAAPDLTQFNKDLGSFLDEVNTALPDSAVVGGTWSDSYIGQIVGLPPHFGIGFAAGATRFPVGSLNDAIADVGSSGLSSDIVALPNFALEARLGGFVLPFDIGFRFGMIPQVTLNNVTVKYINYGLDVRYDIIKEGLVKPDFIVGLGYYHTDGDVTYTFGAGTPFPLKEDLDVSFSTNVFEAKTQVSKTFMIITPYAGLGGYMATNKSSYSVYTENGSSNKTVYGARVFGGFSFNIMALKLDFSGMYNLSSGNWGANLGTRIQF